MKRTWIAALGLAAGFGALSAHAQATRTWVSGVGDDVNPCSRTAPCKTFAGAISKTAAAGVINCLDPGAYGAVTITKSLTIDCTGVAAGVLATIGSSGIVVNVAASDVVTLRGLNIDGGGTGANGINFVGAGTLHVDQCRITGFRGGTATGIRVATTAAADLYVSDTSITDNGIGTATGGGIVARPTGSGGANVALRRVSINNNSQGLLIDGSGGTGAVRAQVVDSTVGGNAGAGVTSFHNPGTGGALILIDRSMIVRNAAHGLLANGADAHLMFSNSTVAVNQPGVGVLNSGKLYTYGNNNVNANIGSDGTPVPSVLDLN